MSSRRESTRRRRWSELLLGGVAAGVGAPLVLRGLRRFLHLETADATAGVGWTAGLLGALVAGGLARRGRLDGPGPEAEPRAAGAEDRDAPVPAEEETVFEARRVEARRRHLAALEQHAAARTDAASGDEVLRALERRARRGPSGREQPWHEGLASSSG